MNDFDFRLDLLQEGSSTIMGSPGGMATFTNTEVKSMAGKVLGYDAQPDNFKNYRSGAGKVKKKQRLRNRF